MDIITKGILIVLNTLVLLTAYPIWFYRWLGKHKTIRRILIYFIIGSALIIQVTDVNAYLTILGVVGQFAFAAIFMIAQFAFLFMFLSSTKNIETEPGDVGLVSFENDYFGQEVLVDSVRQWVGLMTDEGKAKLEAMGAEPIHGLLLEGPPGTGKTLLAQCLSTDTGAAFIGMSGTDFQAMFIGVGPMKVMQTYGKAKKKANRHGACIVFIDEADAIGGNRGGVAGDARRAPVAGGMAGGMFGGGGLGVLSKLLTELDGVKEISLLVQAQNDIRELLGIPIIKQGVVFTILATNRPDALDPALTRPGRVDKRIRVDPPDKHSRRLIIEGYLRKVKHDDTVDAERLTEDTQGVTPAQLASSIQRSAPRYAIYEGRDYITQADIEHALQEDIVGLANPITDFDPIQKKAIAYHEAGHALVAWKLRPQKRITTVSIIRRGGGILGYVRDVEETEIYALPLERLAANIQVSLAGHLAAKLAMGQSWSGATSDIRNIQYMMYSLAMHGEFGQLPFKSEDPFSSTEIKESADAFLKNAERQTNKLLIENRALLDKLAETLLEKDELSSSEVYEILGDPR